MGDDMSMKIGFSEEIKNSTVSTFFISSEIWPGFILAAFGLRKPLRVPWPGFQTVTWLGIKRRISKQLQQGGVLDITGSVTNCKDYPTEAKP